MLCKLVSVLLIVLITLTCTLVGCGGQVSGTDFDGFDIPANTERDPSANGQPFGDVHELHSGIVGCMDCHATHGMMFDWQIPDRDYCLTCHPDKDEQHSSQDCLMCHNSSGGPGNG